MHAKIGLLLLILAILLGGCGYNGSNSVSSSATSQASATPAPARSTPSPGSTRGSVKSTPSPVSTPAKEGVEVTTSTTTYQPEETIVVTILNATKASIVFTNHQSNCTVVLLQRQAGQVWETIAPCKLMVATRRQTLEPGGRLTILLRTGGTFHPAGNYRIAFNYSEQTGRISGPLLTAYSPLFRVVAKF